MSATDLAALARSIIDANRYLTLGTADAEGRPWVSPVWFAAAGYAEFHWVSSPEATHSRNLAVRPQVSIVIFDSRVPMGTGQAVYMSGVAEELSGAALERGIEVFSRVSGEQGGSAWSLEDVGPSALHRLYRATAEQHSVLDPEVHGVDARTPVTP